MFRNNKLTSITGAGAGIAMLIDGITEGNWFKIVGGACTIFLGIFSKDFNKTGTGK